MKLLCFPYAGGSAVKFLSWKKYLDGIEVIALDPPGRGRRMEEPLNETIEEMVDDLKKQVLSVLGQGEEYAIYAHSMGTMLVYELLHSLLEDGFRMPVHVFLSGKNPPHYLLKEKTHRLEDAQLIKKIINMGGMDPNFFEDPIRRKVYLPIFRSDFRILETYRYEKKQQQLPIDVTFLFAPLDIMLCFNRVKRWADYITGTFKINYFFGGHFFFFGQEEKVAEVIKEVLLNDEEEIPY
jgi:surfactin synthase thioesterase subunit